MPMHVTDSVLGASRGDREVAIQRAVGKGATGPFREFIREIFRVAPLMPTPIDPACAVAQSALETGYWTENEWVQDLNPGGIGITEEGVPSPFNAPFVQTGERAARLMLLEIWAHLRPTPPIPAAVADMVEVDGWLEKVQAAQRDPNRPAVRTLRDLHRPYTSSQGRQECTWACDPEYSIKLVARGNLLFPGLPNQISGGTTMAFGNVQHPPFENRPISNPNGSFNQGVPRDIIGTCVHRMDGTLRGSDQFFQTAGALTDYGIGGALDGALDGVIYRWLDPRSSIVPIASGPFDGPEGDGQAFVNAYGVPAINSQLVSIELSGCSGEEPPNVSNFCRDRPETPITPAQLESLCQLIAFWHDQARVPWDQFPVNPATGVVTQMQHFEFAQKACPFPIVRGMTDQYQERVRQIMRAAQETHFPFEAFRSPRLFTVPDDRIATGRSAPTTGAARNRDFLPGTTIECDGFFIGEAVGGENRWLRTTAEPRLAIHASGVSEAI